MPSARRLSKRRNEDMSRRLRFLCVVTLSLLLGSCGGGGQTPKTGETSVPAASNNNASLNKDDYPVFPDTDAGADPAVSAEQGGKGFTGQGWETNTKFELIGDPRAVKGGVFREHIADFPGTLRMGGPEWNTSTNYTIGEMVYETLIALD